MAHSVPDGVTGARRLPDLSQNISGNFGCQRPGKRRQRRTGRSTRRSFMARGQVRYKGAAGRPLYGGTHNNNTVSPDFSAREATRGGI